MKRVLVTGAYGFLGRHTASFFKQNGYEVIGLGHGHWGFENPGDFGIDEWIETDVDEAGLTHVKGRLNSVIHCAGGSTVGLSVEQPLREFQRTVDSTLCLLEYIRLKHPKAVFTYPSSAAVYGEQIDIPLAEDVEPAPVSPYGFYKKIVEDLCESYSKNFDVEVVIIRFFSIYGAGLQKQLFWDACRKFSSQENTTCFFGSGTETRDFLHVKDAAELIYTLGKSASGFEIFNGGSGKRMMIKNILELISSQIDTSTKFYMDGQYKKGDPNYYWADITKAQKYGWEPKYRIEDGIAEYVKWFKSNKL